MFELDLYNFFKNKYLTSYAKYTKNYQDIKILSGYINSTTTEVVEEEVEKNGKQ